MRNASNPLETGNQELLRRATHQAYKIIDNEQSSKSSSQMENLVAMLWMGGEEKKKKSKDRKGRTGRKLGSGREECEGVEWGMVCRMGQMGENAPPIHHQFNTNSTPIPSQFQASSKLDSRFPKFHRLVSSPPRKTPQHAAFYALFLPTVSQARTKTFSRQLPEATLESINE